MYGQTSWAIIFLLSHRSPFRNVLLQLQPTTELREQSLVGDHSLGKFPEICLCRLIDASLHQSHLFGLLLAQALQSVLRRAERCMVTASHCTLRLRKKQNKMMVFTLFSVLEPAMNGCSIMGLLQQDRRVLVYIFICNHLLLILLSYM